MICRLREKRQCCYVTVRRRRGEKLDGTVLRAISELQQGLGQDIGRFQDTVCLSKVGWAGRVEGSAVRRLPHCVEDGGVFGVKQSQAQLLLSRHVLSPKPHCKTIS
jgi:hypothetical protein